MRHILNAILEQQLLSGFPDLAGTHADATIPIADRLLNDLIARLLPDDGLVRQVVLSAREGNEIEADVQVGKGGMTLPIRLVLEVESQPELPQQPELVLRLKKAPRLLMLSGAARMFDALPAGLSMDGDRIRVNLETLLAPYDTARLFRYLTEVRITTNAGFVVLNLRAGLGPAPA